MTDEEWTKGLEVFDAVYGPGSSAMVTAYKDRPFNQEIVAIDETFIGSFNRSPLPRQTLAKPLLGRIAPPP